MIKDYLHTMMERFRATPKTIKVLDHGFVEFVEHWGSDRRVIEAARQSTNKGFMGWNNDAGLLRYLYANEHKGPFEMAGMVLEIKAPIMVFRQWHRHRTQSYDEMSGRYVPLPNENYMPTVERCLTVHAANKQANSMNGKVPTDEMVKLWLNDLNDLYVHAEAVYRVGLEMGLPKEVARLPVPLARYSKMRVSANLRNWIAFLTLRDDSHAQLETRLFAQAVGQLIERQFPRTHDLYLKHKRR